MGWRVARRRYCERPHEPFDGIGASLSGGRWNSPKTLVAYASSSLSLATLEYLAHIDREDIPADIIRVSITFDDSDVETMREPYPAGWNQVAPPAAARRVGDDWVRESRSLVLAVPSVLVPIEANFLINPSHPRRAHATVGELEDYPLDTRLI